MQYNLYPTLHSCNVLIACYAKHKIKKGDKGTDSPGIEDASSIALHVCRIACSKVWKQKWLTATKRDSKTWTFLLQNVYD